MERKILRGLVYAAFAWSCLVYVSAAMSEGRYETEIGFAAVIFLAALTISAPVIEGHPAASSEPLEAAREAVGERSPR